MPSLGYFDSSVNLCLIMPRAKAPRRSQPKRAAAVRPLEEVVVSLFDELKELREEVAHIRQERRLAGTPSNQDHPPPDIVDTEAGPSNQHDVPPAMEQAASSGPRSTDSLRAPPDSPAARGGDPPMSHTAYYGAPWPAGYQHQRSPNLQAGNMGSQMVHASATTHQVLLSQQALPSSAVPQVDIVPAKLRKDIIQGKDVNLALLLLPIRERHYASPSHRDIKVGEEILTLKPLKDSRLTKPLTIQEFVKAFNIYKKIMCEQYPHRHPELDTYLNNLIDVSTKFQGFIFYDYHLEFAARSAHLLETRHIRLDWAIMDDIMLSRLVAGRKPTSCSLCNGFDHVTGFCPLTADKPYKPFERKSAQRSDEYCFNFNSIKGCSRARCHYPHVCSHCKAASHGASDCRSKLPGRGNSSA